MRTSEIGFVLCDWTVIGEDTGGSVRWCRQCGCVKGSEGSIETPEHSELPPACEQLDKKEPKEKKEVVPYSELKNGKCLNNMPHRLWFNMTGDTYPAFCANFGCNKVSNDVPSDADENT